MPPKDDKPIGKLYAKTPDGDYVELGPISEVQECFSNEPIRDDIKFLSTGEGSIACNYGILEEESDDGLQDNRS